MRPHLTLTERLQTAGRMAVPYAFMALLFVLNVISVPYPLSMLFKAPFFLMAVYYWSIYRPGLIPPWLAFGSGLLLDLLSGAPLGLNAALFVLCRMAVVDQRRFLFGQGFAMIWLGFACLHTVFVLLQWLVFSAIQRQWFPLADIGVITVLGIAMFPLICAFLRLTHRALHSSS